MSCSTKLTFYSSADRPGTLLTLLVLYILILVLINGIL